MSDIYTAEHYVVRGHVVHLVCRSNGAVQSWSAEYGSVTWFAGQATRDALTQKLDASPSFSSFTGLSGGSSV